MKLTILLFLFIKSAWALDENMLQTIDRAGSHYQEYKNVKENIRKGIRSILHITEEQEPYFMFLLPTITGNINIKHLRNVRHVYIDDKIRFETIPILEYNIRRDEFKAGAQLTITF